MLYRLLCSFNDGFGLVVFFGYLAAFVLAFLLVFLFPPGALALVLLGLVGLVLVWIFFGVSKAIEASLGRRSIDEGTCPECGEELLPPVESSDPVYVCCSECGQAYELTGRRFQPDHDEEGVQDLSTL